MDKQRGHVILASAAIVLLSIRERLRGTDKDVRLAEWIRRRWRDAEAEFLPFSPSANCDLMYDLPEHESGKVALATGC